MAISRSGSYSNFDYPDDTLVLGSEKDYLGWWSCPLVWETAIK